MKDKINNLKNIALKNTDFYEILKKGGVALLIRILGFISGYLFIYYIVKFFGAETQGRLSLSFSIMIIGSLFCRLGVDINFVKIFAIKDNFENAKGIYFKVFPYILGLSLIIALLVFFGSDFISNSFFNDPSLSVFLKWTSPCIVLFTFVLLNASVLRGLKKNGIYSFLFNGGRFLFALIIFLSLIAFAGKNAEYTIIAHTFAILALFIISVFYIYKYIFPKHKESTYKTKIFLKQSLPMLFSTSMIIFLGWSDTIILGIYKDSSVVGIYNVVLKISVVTSFTFQAIDSILAPKLSASYHINDLTLFKKLVKYSTLFNLAASVFFVLMIIIFKDFILNIFGEEFKIASTALIILCLGQLFNAICGPVGSILQMTGHQIVFQNVLFIALLINISLNLILIKPYGINGVATATAFSLAFWNVASIIYIKKKVY